MRAGGKAASKISDTRHVHSSRTSILNTVYGKITSKDLMPFAWGQVKI
jgi:hypothetical protein